MEDMMKRSILYAVLAVALLLTSCGSSRQTMAYYPAQPATNPMQVEETTVVVPHRASRRETTELRLARRLDSLVVAENLLLSQSQLGLHVIDLNTGMVLYARGEHQRMRPASTEKVVTAISALALLGPQYTLDTKLLATAPIHGGVLQGDLYVRGCMDPLLSVADVRNMVGQLRAAGVQRITGRLVGDASFKDTDEYGWGWCWDDKNPVLSPMLCGGKPGLVMELRQALQRAGIRIGAVVMGRTPAGARELVVLRRPLTEVLEPMMKKSDNLCAEAVFYQMGVDRKQVATRMTQVVGPESAAMIADGSGLSLYNYQTPATFTRLLAFAAAQQENIFQPLLAALPVAGVDGTLRNRMAGTAAAVAVRAKTGTVTGVSSLVGYTTQRSTNHVLAFAIMNQGVPTGAQGRAFQDEVCRLLSE